MIKVKEEKMERAANFARVMREQTMLGNFIRLADYMFVEGGPSIYVLNQTRFK
jgi:dynein heavy chain